MCLGHRIPPIRHLMKQPMSLSTILPRGLDEPHQAMKILLAQDQILAYNPTGVHHSFRILCGLYQLQLQLLTISQVSGSRQDANYRFQGHVSRQALPFLQLRRYPAQWKPLPPVWRLLKPLLLHRHRRTHLQYPLNPNEGSRNVKQPIFAQKQRRS
jgi:hypothetical protein